MFSSSFDRNIDTLPADVHRVIKEQYQLIDRINDEPAFTIKRYFLFLWKVFLFFLFLFLLVYTFMINVFLFVVNSVIKKKIYVPNYFIRYSKKAIKELWSGEPNFLCLIPSRYFIRVFCTIHLKKRIKTVARFVQKNEIIAQINNDEEAMSRLGKLNTFLNKYMDSLSKGLQLPLLVVTASYFGAVGKIIDHTKDVLPKAKNILPDNTKGGSGMDLKELFLNPISFLSNIFDSQSDVFNQIFANHSVIVITLLIVFLVMTVAFIVIPSSFIRARQLMKEQDIYNSEYFFANKYGIFIPVEFPLDLVLYMVPVLIFSFPMLMIVLSPLLFILGDNIELFCVIVFAAGVLFFLLTFLKRLRATKKMQAEAVAIVPEPAIAELAVA